MDALEGSADVIVESSRKGILFVIRTSYEEYSGCSEELIKES